MGSPRRVEPVEQKRINVFRQLHGTWPPTKQYPGGFAKVETEAWGRAMEAREDMIRKTTDHTQKWELWLDLAQMHFAKNFTPSGWSSAELDPEAHAEVASIFASKKDLAVVEEIGDNLAHMFIVGQREHWDFRLHLPSDLQKRMLNSIRTAVSKWSGISSANLSLEAAYGARVYHNNSILKVHLDHVETHVLSAVYCIAIEGEEDGQQPWYLGAFPDFTGQDATVDVRPGQLFLYESAKLPHGRPGTFRGDKYVAMFVHFKPRGWNLENFDRVYSLPPGWAEAERVEL